MKIEKIVTYCEKSYIVTFSLSEPHLNITSIKIHNAFDPSYITLLSRKDIHPDIVDEVFFNHITATKEALKKHLRQQTQYEDRQNKLDKINNWDGHIESYIISEEDHNLN